MALSRGARLCLSFAAIAIGVGAVIATVWFFDPKIWAGIGALLGGVGAVARAIDRLKKRRRSSGAPETEAHE
jgi:hypothetical protein